MSKVSLVSEALENRPSSLCNSEAQQALLSAYEDYCKAHVPYISPRSIPPSAAVLLKFPKLSLEKIKFVIKSLKLATGWIIEARQEGDSPLIQRHLKKALQHFGLSLDPYFLETLEDDTLVEIYSPEMVQLYRSFNFLEVTGYSVLDLSVFEWYVLWERAPYATSQLMALAQDTFKNKSPLTPITVGPHVLREGFNSGMTEPFWPRYTEIKMEHIGYLHPNRVDSPIALICTSKARILSYEAVDKQNLLLLK